MFVLKFGGTSVQDAEAVRRLIEIVKTRQGKRLVVVSALAKVTDQLVEIGILTQSGQSHKAIELSQALLERHLKMARELGLSEQLQSELKAEFQDLSLFILALESVGECTGRSRDRILAVGELCSSRMVADAFRVSDESSQWLDSREVVKTEAEFTVAPVRFVETEQACLKIVPTLFKKVDVVVCGGFIASTTLGGKSITTTLGRGGSDYSAAILGAALSAEKIEIWTDVDGILTTDPRMVPKARRLEALRFDEAAELAYFGAKVLHPATIYPAVKKKIPVWVLNSKNPTCSGTVITEETPADSNVIKALACKRKITLVNIHSTRMLGAAGFLKSVFESFARHQVSIDLISTSEVNVSLTLDPNTDNRRLEEVKAELEAIAQITIEHEMASVAVVGHGIRESTGIGSRLFGALKGIPVYMVSMGASDVNLSFVVKDAGVTQVVERLHHEFFEKSFSNESN